MTNNKNIKLEMNYVSINNEFLVEENEFHLTPDELYVYILLSIERNYESKVNTTVKTLSTIAHIKLSKNTRTNLENMKNTLISLRNKGAIRLVDENGEINDTFKQNDVIIIELVDTEGDIGGHTQVFFKDFYRFNSTEMLTVYLACYKWYNSDSSTFTCAFTRWAKVLQCSKSHAEEVVNEAVAQGYIYKKPGMRVSGVEQKTNEYKAMPLSEVTTPQPEAIIEPQDESQDEPQIASNEQLEDVTEAFDEPQEESIEPLEDTVQDDSEASFLSVLEELGIEAPQEKTELLDTLGRFEQLNATIEDYVILLDLREQKELTELESKVIAAANNLPKMLKGKSALLAQKSIQQAKILKADRDVRIYAITESEYNTVIDSANNKITQLNSKLNSLSKGMK